MLQGQVTKSSGFSDCVYEVQSYSIALENLVNKYQKNKNNYELTLRNVKKIDSRPQLYEANPSAYDGTHLL